MNKKPKFTKNHLIVILSILLVISSLSLAVFIANQRIEQIKSESYILGQQNILREISRTVNSQGYFDLMIQINETLESVTMAPYTLAYQQGSQDSMSRILEIVNTEGVVELTYPLENNETATVVLVPYDFGQSMEFFE